MINPLLIWPKCITGLFGRDIKHIISLERDTHTQTKTENEQSLANLTYKFVEYAGLVEELQEQILILPRYVRDQGHCHPLTLKILSVS